MCDLCTVKHIANTVGDGSAPYRCVICRERVGMLECWKAGCCTAVPTALNDSSITKGEVLGVVAYLRACAQDAFEPLSAAASGVLLAAGRAVRAPVRGFLFGPAAAASPVSRLAPAEDEDEEYQRIEDAVTDLLFSPEVITDLNQISEFIGATPASLASSRTSPAAPTEHAGSPDSQQIVGRRRRRRPPASASADGLA